MSHLVCCHLSGHSGGRYVTKESCCVLSGHAGGGDLHETVETSHGGW